ncbi:MAG TPA: acyltransferase [Flavisolibacter sp.]|nr:acyltransferase [Flavisolibacter sp.]
MEYKKRYFATFDALRFFAFLKVYLLHLPIVAFPAFNFIRSGGDIGVNFFFVLSGFLITYILLEEKKATQKIELKKFFVRRILRIWPLYYLMVAFAYLTPFILKSIGLSYSNVGYEPNWLMTCLFLENYQIIWTGNVPNVSPLAVMWSVCVEEHFYIVWGVLLYCLPINRVPLLIFISLLITIVARYIFGLNEWSFLDLSTNIGYFAFGAIPAYLSITRGSAFEDFLQAFSKGFKYVFLLIVILIVLICPFWQYTYAYLVIPLVLGLLFSILISLTLPFKNALFISNKSVISRLGIFTYGLYMYHTIVINFVLQLYNSYELPLGNALNALLFVILTLIMTVAASLASYYLFERYFLRLKKYFYPS